MIPVELSFWDILTFLWQSAVSFMGMRIEFLDIDFSLWEAAVALAIISILLYAIFRCLD